MKKNPLISYYLSLINSLEKEVLTLKPRIENYRNIITRVSNLKKYVISRPEIKYKKWLKIDNRYKDLLCLKANELNKTANISLSYSSMDEFWSDFKLQTQGLSDNTIWDTYEHGKRRKLEKILASVYGSKECLLLNSGMSSVGVAFGMRRLKKGDLVITSKKNYFETCKFIDDWLKTIEVKILRIDVTNFEEVTKKLKLKPKIVFVESVTNEPTLRKPDKLNEWMRLSKDTLFVIDNSIQSFNTKWFDKVSYTKNLVVIESGTKYLTHECMSGILHGDERWVELARDFARDTGQQLQEKAFNFIDEGSIRNVGKKLKIHTRNVLLFKNYVESSDIKESVSIKILDSENKGSLLFITVKKHHPNKKVIYENIVNFWKDNLSKKGYLVDIRAGFGWNRTSVRIYDTKILNQKDAPSYIRISIGIEPQEAIQEMALVFVGAIKKVHE